MMACSYLSAGGLKSEPTNATCWSPPSMVGCLAAETRPAPKALPTPPITLPIQAPGPIGLQNSPKGLPIGPMGLPRTAMALPRPSMAVPSGQLGLPSGPVDMPNQSLGFPNESMGLSSGVTNGQLGLSRPVGPMVLQNAQMGLPPPFSRPLPLDLHGLAHSGALAPEPALDLSTSASMTTSQPRLPNEDTE